MFQASIAANDYQVKSCIMVAICQPTTSGNTVHFPEILQTARDVQGLNQVSGGKHI